MNRILKYPDTQLFQLSGFIRNFKDEKFLEMCDSLSELVDKVDEKILCGLQIGIPKKVLVFIDNQGKKQLMVNPSIFSHNNKQKNSESSVSFGNLVVEVERFNGIKIMYQDIDGSQKFYETFGLESAKLQRTVNMMDGELLVDKLNKKEKAMYDKRESFDSMEVCPTGTNRGTIISFIRMLLGFQFFILITKNIFSISSIIGEYNLLISIFGVVLLFMYAIYAKYETSKYKNCTSCQGANMLGNFIGYGTVLISLYFLIKFF